MGGKDDLPNPVHYLMGIVGNDSIRLGGGLGMNGLDWRNISKRLPKMIEHEHDNSACTVASDFTLYPHDTKVIRFILA